MNLRNNSMQQLSINPTGNIQGTSWLLAKGLVGSPGQAMGVMGLTYSNPVVDTYTFNIRTGEGTIIGVNTTKYV